MELQPDTPTGFALLLGLLVAAGKLLDLVIGWVGAFLGYQRSVVVEQREAFVEFKTERDAAFHKLEADIDKEMAFMRQQIDNFQDKLSRHFGELDGRLSALYKEMMERDEAMSERYRREMREALLDHEARMTKQLDGLVKLLADKIEGTRRHGR